MREALYATTELFLSVADVEEGTNSSVPNEKTARSTDTSAETKDKTGPG